MKLFGKFGFEPTYFPKTTLPAFTQGENVYWLNVYSAINSGFYHILMYHYNELYKKFNAYTDNGSVEVCVPPYTDYELFKREYKELQKVFKKYEYEPSSALCLESEGGCHINIDLTATRIKHGQEFVDKMLENYRNFMVSHPSAVWMFLSPYDNNSSNITFRKYLYEYWKGEFFTVRQKYVYKHIETGEVFEDNPEVEVETCLSECTHTFPQYMTKGVPPKRRPVVKYVEGMKVVRGRDWQWDNQDAGSLYGVVTSIHSGGWVNVHWIKEDGTRATSVDFSYRIGSIDGGVERYDLYEFDSAIDTVRHSSNDAKFAESSKYEMIKVVEYIEMRHFMMPRTDKEFDLHFEYANTLLQYMYDVTLAGKHIPNEYLNAEDGRIYRPDELCKYTLPKAIKEFKEVCKTIGFDYKKVARTDKLELLRWRFELGADEYLV